MRLWEQEQYARTECFSEFLWQDGVADDGNATGDERSVRLARHAHLHRASRIVFFRENNLLHSNDSAVVVFREITMDCEQLNFFRYVLCKKRFRDVFRRNVNVLCAKVRHTGQDTALVETSDRIE